MITGSTYLERGVPVAVAAAWNGKRDGLAAAAAATPLVHAKGVSGPRNVRIVRADGSTVVRPFRGLRKPAKPEYSRDQRWGGTA